MDAVFLVMAGLVPAIHVFGCRSEIVDVRAFAAPKEASAPQAGQARA